MGRTLFCILVNLCTGPCGGLQSSKKKSTGENVMILISLLYGHSNRTITEHWQHISFTILASLHEAIDIFLKKHMIFW
jgi:hypothetical protein